MRRSRGRGCGFLHYSRARSQEHGNRWQSGNENDKFFHSVDRLVNGRFVASAFARCIRGEVFSYLISNYFAAQPF
jgi:hypothetical protein